MSETASEKPRLFQFPDSGDYQLPKFQKYDMESVPREVHEQIFHLKSQDEVAKSTLLRSPQALDFGDAGKVFVLAYHQQRMAEGYPSWYYAVYAVDIGKSGELMGYGLSFLELDENNQEKGEPPFVQYTHTQDEFRNQGLAVRRLIVLNETNKALLKHLLSSGSFAAEYPAAERAWQRLVDKGLAVRDEDGYYRFIK